MNNPYACLQKEYPVEAVAKSRVLCEPITMAMASPTADGSAAAIMCNEEFMLKNGLQVI